MADSHAIVVVQRRLLVELVVPSQPAGVALKVMRMLQGAHYSLGGHEPQSDGYHIRVLCEWRQQQLLNSELTRISAALGVSFRDSTNNCAA